MLFFIQKSWIQYTAILGITPDILLAALVIWISRRQSRIEGVLAGFSVGLLQDLSGNGIIGLTSLSKSIACFITGSLPWNRFVKNGGMICIALFISAFIHQVIYILFISRINQTGFMIIFLRYGIPSALYTTLCGCIIYGILVGCNCFREAE